VKSSLVLGCQKTKLLLRVKKTRGLAAIHSKKKKKKGTRKYCAISTHNADLTLTHYQNDVVGGGMSKTQT